MHFLRAGLIQEVHGLLQLRASYDGIVDKEELFILDQRGQVGVYLTKGLAKCLPL